MDIESITFLESTYLFYMFFYFKTTYSFDFAIFDKEVQSINPFFIHDTNDYQNKICGFGRLMAIIAIILAQVRIYNKDNKNIIPYIIGFDVFCIVLALLMNFNAVVYILPLIASEIYLAKNINI
jgi:hypothetical protein